jgi:hypothetical protein
MEEAKENFMYQLFLENCEERQNFNDTLYTFSEYIRNNKEYIEDKWHQHETSS